MHEPLLRRAALSAPAIVMGLRLRPYSIGHELLLNEEEIPDDLQLALARATWICSNTWQENQRTFMSPRATGFKIWLWRNLNLSLRRYKRLARKFKSDYLEIEIRAFAEYRRLGSEEFPLADNITGDSKEKGRAMGAPFLLLVQQFLMMHLRLSENEAWDYPFGLAKMRWIAWREDSGGIDVANRLDMEHERFVAEQEAIRLAKETNGKEGPPCRA